jgi:hypothetical protein
MTIHDLIKKYGTRGISLVLKRLGEGRCDGLFLTAQMASDLQSALEDYASEDFEPPTVGNEVV